VRQRGFSNENAKDIVQEFIKTLIERNAFLRADPSRGKFRTYLLSALTNFLKDWARSENRLKRGGAQTTFSLDFVGGESEYAREVARGDTPETVLNRSWARSLWSQALRDLAGDPAHLEAFRLYLADENYATISAKTGLSEAAAKTAVHRLKGQLKELITGYILETSVDEADLEAELGEFIALLR
jgi:RNA polymerase sigma-70 factor (ECF subfamily)